MTPNAILQALVEARRSLEVATHTIAPLHDHIKEQEGGLDHVMRQLQNADIIMMFMEREWRRVARDPDRESVVRGWLAEPCGYCAGTGLSGVGACSACRGTGTARSMPT